jgi:hypothetical protein
MMMMFASEKYSVSRRNIFFLQKKASFDKNVGTGLTLSVSLSYKIVCNKYRGFFAKQIGKAVPATSRGGP